MNAETTKKVMQYIAESPVADEFINIVKNKLKCGQQDDIDIYEPDFEFLGISIDDIDNFVSELKEKNPGLLVNEKDVFPIIVGVIISKLIVQQNIFFTELNSLRTELQNRWLNWDMLNEKLNKLERVFSGKTQQKEAKSTMILFLKKLYDESRPTIPDSEDSPRLILQETVTKISLSFHLRRPGGYYQRYLKAIDEKWAVLTKETIKVLEIAGEIQKTEPEK